MGGMDGFGDVVREADEPVFHADWERRTWGLAALAMRGLSVNQDEFRHAIERMRPARYLASTYYERWLSAVETLLVERGVVTRDELLAKLGDSIDPAAIGDAVTARAPAPAKDVAVKPRFAKGDRVRARNINPGGHTRLPRYVRGKTGVIARDWGTFTFPDTNAHHAGTRPQHCYSVVFDARELWGKQASGRERVYIDLWDDYLEPVAQPAAKKKTPKRKAATSKRARRK